MAQLQVAVPFKDGYFFGVGVDLLSGAFMNQPVKNDNVSDDPQGPIIDITIQRIQTTHDLEEALGISAEASYGSPSFGAGISGRFDFARKAKVQSTSLFMTVTSTIKLNSPTIHAPFLTDEAIKIADNPVLFAERFGNVFVHSMDRGGIFVGVMRLDTSSSEEAESINSELEGSYGAFSAKASENFSRIEKNFNSSLFVQMYHEGGPANLKIEDPTNPMELLRNANLFLDSFQEHPDSSSRHYFVTLSPITIANGPIPPNGEDIAHAQDVMRFCAQRRSTLLDQLNLLEVFVDSPFRFDFSNGANLKEIAAAAANTQSDLDLISHCASAAINSPKSAVFPTDFAAAKGAKFPSAVMPELLPIGKPHPVTEKTIPKFVGLTVTAANALAADIGIPIEYRHAESEDDIFQQDLQLLELGNDDDEHPHTDNQIVVNVQLPAPGTVLKAGSIVGLGVELGPGVPA